MIPATLLDEYPKTVVLNDGAHLVLRAAAPGDAAALARLGPGATATDDGAVTVVAVDDGGVAGMAALLRGAHAAERRLVLSLAPAYAGRRLGTWMLLDCIHLAIGLGAERLVARVAGGDEAFAAALARLDFVEVAGAEPGGVRLLAKTLHRAWTDF